MGRRGEWAGGTIPGCVVLPVEVPGHLVVETVFLVTVETDFSRTVPVTLGTNLLCKLAAGKGEGQGTNLSGFG